MLLALLLMSKSQHALRRRSSLPGNWQREALCVNMGTHTQTAAIALALEVITLLVAPLESKFPKQGKS